MREMPAPALWPGIRVWILPHSICKKIQQQQQQKKEDDNFSS